MHFKTIAVHGASGSQGAPVAARLEAGGHSVRRLSRVTGVDLLDRQSLDAAYAEADTVVLQLPLVYDERALVMADNAANAAAAAGVSHLVLNTSAPLPPQPIGVPFLDARHRAAGAAVPMVTVLQPTFYLENLTSPWQAPRTMEGLISSPLPAEVPMPWVATDDVAVAIERAINQAVTGSFVLPGQAVTGHQIAKAIAAVVGHAVRWETITPTEYGDLLRPHLGDHAADGIAGVYTAMAAAPAQPAPDPAPAREALGWAPRDIDDWAAHVPAFTRASGMVESGR
ncbi:SDR family oxidoreductase [Kribbella sp. CA-253562]|uniref:SDR family oxidoreductase n=1 Tax=Kribbella sp. CA-253562 TaxID=3239942 RepID=UPI003D8E0C60